MFKKLAATALGGCLLVAALCLGLLPATALAAGEGEPNNLYVGNQNVSSGENTTYWTTDDNGGLDQSDENADWNVKYDPTNATLTLRYATIKTTHNSGKSAVIYAQSDVQSAVSLTIELEGTNTIVCDSALFGIYVNAEMSNESYGTDASLTITGEGSLDVSVSSYGIWVKSGSGDASLTVENASVVASTTSQFYSGVVVQSSIFSQNSPALSLAVNGGSLTASGGDGISFNVGSSGDIGATTRLTISDNAIVRAENGIKAYRVDEPTPSGAGIVFNDKKGTVYGDVTLDESLTIDQGETLTIPEGSSLTSNDKLANNGTVTIENGGTLTDADKVTNAGTINVESGGTLNGTPAGGTVVYAPVITANPTSQTVTEGEAAEFSVAATGENSSYQWQQNADGDGWVDIPGATGASYTTEATTTSMSGYQYRCVVSNSAGSVTSSAATLTVNEHVHEWVVTWSWDGTKATATFTCEGDATHQETPEVEVTSAVKTPATCTEAGVTTYTATVEFDGKTYTSTKDIADIPAAGHKLTKTEAKAPACTEPGSAEYWTCGVCGKVFSDAAGGHEITPEDAVIQATGHEFEGGLCSVCGARDTSFSPALVSGDGSKWTKGSSKGLTFVSSAAFADLAEVRLDGRVLSASEYAVREGSTIVTLPAKLLEGLKAGDHELLIVSGSGTVRASLTVAEAAKVEEAAKTEKASADELPASGDSTAPALAVAAAAAAGAGLVLLSRRRAAR